MNQQLNTFVSTSIDEQIVQISVEEIDRQLVSAELCGDRVATNNIDAQLFKLGYVRRAIVDPLLTAVGQQDGNNTINNSQTPNCEQANFLVQNTNPFLGSAQGRATFQQC